MEKFFTIGETAKLAHVTAETLRHYDRIGLVHPCKTDKWTGYRYYSEQELARLNTVRALCRMDLSLREIKDILQLNDFAQIVELLKRAEENADKKIAELAEIKEKIARARHFYESKAAPDTQDEPVLQELPRRVILLSDELREPTVGNLWNYHRHFYAQVGDRKDVFTFEDLAGVYIADGEERMFAVCSAYAPSDNLRTLPAGAYLCADCTEETRRSTAERLLQTAKERYSASPDFSVHIVVLTGILQWNYRLQVPVRLAENT